MTSSSSNQIARQGFVVHAEGHAYQIKSHVNVQSTPLFYAQTYRAKVKVRCKRDFHAEWNIS